MKFDMIIFDLDGTLWETEDCTYKSVNEILKKYNTNEEITLETVRKTMGCTFAETAEYFMPYFDKEKREMILKEMLDFNNERLIEIGGNLYPKLEETLKKLNEKYRLTIVSNCADGYIEAFLDTSKLGKYFDDFIAAAKMKVTKAEAIKKIMERNNIDSAIYVGDTQKDLDASQGAGIDFIHAKYGFGKIEKNPIYKVYTIEQLPVLIDTIEEVE